MRTIGRTRHKGYNTRNGMNSGGAVQGGEDDKLAFERGIAQHTSSSENT